LSRFIAEQSKEHTHSIQNTLEGVVKTHGIQTTPEGDVKCVALACHFLPRSARNTYGFQNTQEGDVIMYYTGLLYSLPGIPKKTNKIQRTPEGDGRM
jgi:hypothetical protein